MLFRSIECERLALGRDARIKHSDGAGFSSHLGIKVYGNSHGFVKGYSGSRHSLSCVLIGEQDGEMQRDYGYSSCRAIEDLWTPEKIAQEAVERTVSRLGARKIGTTSVPVLFDPETAAGLFGHLVAAISGGNLYRKSSFLLDALGQPIFPNWLNIFEQALLPRGLASSAFDGEGVKTRDQKIIAAGKLKFVPLANQSGIDGYGGTGDSGGVEDIELPQSPNVIEEHVVGRKAS